MKYTNIVDMHTHSDHSFDGNDSCMELCESAIHSGAMAIAITDHCDIDGADLNVRDLCSNQFFETYKVKNIFEGDILVLQGLEIGQGIYRKEETEKLLRDYDYDFILGSLHNLENMEDFYFLDYKKYDVNYLLEKYFEGLFQLCEWGAFDSLAHLTYPLRYIVAREKMNVDISAFSQITDAIFESLIKNKKALEINTSGLFMDINDTLPNISFIRRFRELGGKYITIGSDSHYAKKVCRGIEQGMDIAAKCGFKNITIYEKREPLLVPIE